MSPVADRLALEEELLRLVAFCETDPLRFVKMMFPWGEPGELEKFDGPDQWQVDILTAVRDGLLTLQAAIQIQVDAAIGVDAATARAGDGVHFNLTAVRLEFDRTLRRGAKQREVAVVHVEHVGAGIGLFQLTVSQQRLWAGQREAA